MTLTQFPWDVFKYYHIQILPYYWKCYIFIYVLDIKNLKHYCMSLEEGKITNRKYQLCILLNVICDKAYVEVQSTSIVTASDVTYKYSGQSDYGNGDDTAV